MNDTDRLIGELAARAAPVRPLASPLHRAVVWLVAALALGLAIALMQGLRPDLLEAMREPPALLEWSASLLTGVLAAYATFAVSIPGRSRRWAWLPLPAFALWLAAVGWGCLADTARLGPAAWTMESHIRECAVAILATSVPLTLVLLVLVRHAGVVRPASTAMLAALTATALSSASVTLYHEGETAAMVLVWHVGAVVVASVACLLLGRPMFAWIGHRRA